MQQRRLAAIMFTDIVGYTSMMGKDEKKAFDHLRKNRRIQWRLIKKYRGRWLKEMGDGILASFSSNIDAVMCAVSIQKAAEEMDIPLRIGIHQGDVVFENKDVLGDGVNIASRIQGVADTNGIVISETVYNDIKNKEGIDIEFLGKQTLKGVESSIGAYKVNCKDNSFLEYSIDTGELVRPLGFGRTPIIAGILILALLAFVLYYFLPKMISPQSKIGRSIVVLPFDNYTGSDTLNYFVAGMHSSLIGDIGKIGALQVISKTTANAYKDVEKSIPEIASELGVNVIVEGSVLCLGDSVCLQIKLVSAYPEEQTLWVQDYYEEKSQILGLYKKVTKEISEEINVILTPEEERMLAESRTVDPEAYDAYIKGKLYLDMISLESLPLAKEYFERAIEIDPDWAPPYAGLALVGASEKQMGFVSPSKPFRMIYKNLNKALELDPKSANTHYTKAILAVWTEWDWDTGEKEFLKALELNPSNALCRIMYAHLLYILQRSDEALYQANMALELDPMRPFILGLYSSVLFDVGDFQSAIKHLEKALSIDPGNHFANYGLESLHYWIGDYQKSIEMLTQDPLIEENIRSTMKKAYKEQGYSAAIEVLLAAREEIAKEGFISSWDMASDYRRVKKYDKVLDWLEKGYEIHSPMMPYIGSREIRSDQLEDNPRYIELMEKMNLPLP